MYYTVIKHSSHLRTLGKCRKHSPAARAFYIFLVFSNACRVLSQCKRRLRLLYLLSEVRPSNLLPWHWYWFQFFLTFTNLWKILSNALSSCGPHRNADFHLICAVWNSSIGNPLQRHSPGSSDRSGGGNTSLKTRNRHSVQYSVKFSLTQVVLTITFRL